MSVLANTKSQCLAHCDLSCYSLVFCMFQVLTKLSPTLDKSAFKIALLPTVRKRKNRDSQFIPRTFQCLCIINNAVSKSFVTIS